MGCSTSHAVKVDGDMEATAKKVTGTNDILPSNIKHELRMILPNLPHALIEITLMYWKPKLVSFIDQFASSPIRASERPYKSFIYSKGILNEDFEYEPTYVACNNECTVVAERNRLHIFSTIQKKISVIESSQDKDYFGITLSPEILFACHWSCDRISSFDIEGGQHIEDFTISRPWGITTNLETETLFVTSTLNKELFVLDYDGLVKAKTQLSSFLPDSIPTGIRVYKGLIYICDYKNGQIEIFDATTLKSLNRIGSRGSRPGQLEGPDDLLIHEDLMYISDTKNNRIQIWTLEGRYIAHFGKEGTEVGEFVYPCGLGSKENQLYVSDSKNMRLQVFGL